MSSLEGARKRIGEMSFVSYSSTRALLTQAARGGPAVEAPTGPFDVRRTCIEAVKHEGVATVMAIRGPSVPRKFDLLTPERTSRHKRFK